MAAWCGVACAMVWFGEDSGSLSQFFQPTLFSLSPPQSCPLCVVCLLSAVSYIQQTLLGGKEKEARDAALGSLASEMKVREGS